MARLALELAPATALPMRFLRTVPAWGVLAGMMLAVGGEPLLASRWSPATVALVHVFTLGMLSNAMFGSLLQFLPAAAGVRVRGGAPLAMSLHALLNLGAIALVAGLWASQGILRALGGLLLGLAFVLLAVAALPGLLRRAHQSLLHAGIALSLLAGIVTAALGLALLAAMSGRWALDLPRWTDVHAAVGLLGWIGLLVASVGRVVMPMFQGAAAAPAKVQVAVLAAVALGLPLAAGAGPGALAAFAVLLGLLFGAGGLWLQWRSRKSLQAALPRAWRAGLAAIAAAALVLAGTGDGRLAGTLAIGVGLPLLVLSMLVEISAFLAWIELHRRCGRGVHLPGVMSLLPPVRRSSLQRGFLCAAMLLPLAAWWPNPWTVAAASLALVLANLHLAWAQRALWRTVRVFSAAHAPLSDSLPGARQ